MATSLNPDPSSNSRAENEEGIPSVTTTFSVPNGLLISLGRFQNRKLGVLVVVLARFCLNFRFLLESTFDNQLSSISQFDDTSLAPFFSVDNSEQLCES